MTEERARTGVNEEDFVAAFRAACDALEGAGVPYLFMGGIASIVHGRTSWTHDLDVFIRRGDEPTAVEALVEAGYRLDPTPSSWLSKLWMGDVFLDVIYSSTGPIDLDDAMLERGERAEVWGRKVPVLGPEDLVVTKALAHGEETGALLVGRPRHHRQARARLGLPADAGPPGPAADAQPAAVRAVDRPRGAGPRDPPALGRHAGGRAVTAEDAEERYLPEHLHEALLADERVGEQDLQVSADEHCIHVAGTVSTAGPS